MSITHQIYYSAIQSVSADILGERPIWRILETIETTEAFPEEPTNDYTHRRHTLICACYSSRHATNLVTTLNNAFGTNGFRGGKASLANAFASFEPEE